MRPDRSPVSLAARSCDDLGVEMFLIGFAAGAAVLAIGEVVDRARPAEIDLRQRELTPAQALGYRTALGEVPTEFVTREPVEALL